MWVGLPREVEQSEPSFRHYPSESLPGLKRDGVQLRVLAGAVAGLRSPVETSSDLLCVDAKLAPGAKLQVPGGYGERAAYVVEGQLACGQEGLRAGTLAVFTSDSQPVLVPQVASRVILIGGAPLDGQRYIWWNFVSSSKERIVEAARTWRQGQFPKVPGDEVEFVPLHQEPRFSP
jgi:redox-sensitive bicupin YhaK (pirin superfamily)